MAILAVLADLLLLIAAFGQWLWRPAPPNVWYGNAAFCWGVFFLALFITWPAIHPLL